MRVGMHRPVSVRARARALALDLRLARPAATPRFIALSPFRPRFRAIRSRSRAPAFPCRARLQKAAAADEHCPLLRHRHRRARRRWQCQRQDVDDLQRRILRDGATGHRGEAKSATPPLRRTDSRSPAPTSPLCAFAHRRFLDQLQRPRRATFRNRSTPGTWGRQGSRASTARWSDRFASSDEAKRAPSSRPQSAPGIGKEDVGRRRDAVLRHRAPRGAPHG